MSTIEAPSRSIHLASSDPRLDILAAINDVHLRYRDLDEGSVATYIPELAKVDPDLFGICVVTTDGRSFAIGDSRAAFTLQSIAAPFVYGLMLEELGRDVLRTHIGVEPTGNPFHAIVLDSATNRPMNPMVNAGAIATTSLVPGADPTERLNRILAMLARYIGRAPSVHMEVFISEKTTSDRNRSIAYLVRNFGGLSGVAIDQVLDLYFQQCSVLVDCHDLATMAATLAAGGVNPVSGERAIDAGCLRDVLTIIATCGLYESAGQWMYEVGIPAKSGVSGGMMAVVPGRMGIAVFSPRLTPAGNSVRAGRVCRDLSHRLGLHLFDVAAPPGTPSRSCDVR